MDLKQLLSILHSVAQFGTKHPAVVALGKCLVTKIISHSLETQELSQLVYDLALLENHWKNISPNQPTLFNKTVIRDLLLKAPRPTEIGSVADLNQLFIGLYYFVNIGNIQIGSIAENQIAEYFNPETIHKIKEGSAANQATHHGSASALQHQFGTHLRKYFPAAQEEYFVTILPVDFFIKGVAMIQVNGPRHFVFDVQSHQRSYTPKDLLRSSILYAAQQEPIMTISFDEWDKATTSKTIYLYLQEKFASIGYTLPAELKTQKSAASPTLTYQYKPGSLPKKIGEPYLGSKFRR